MLNVNLSFNLTSNEMLKCFGSFLKTAKLPTTFMLKKSYLFVTTDRHIMSQVTIGNVMLLE